jgi:hypothetical protein
MQGGIRGLTCEVEGVFFWEVVILSSVFVNAHTISLLASSVVRNA